MTNIPKNLKNKISNLNDKLTKTGYLSTVLDGETSSDIQNTLTPATNYLDDELNKRTESSFLDKTKYIDSFESEINTFIEKQKSALDEKLNNIVSMATSKATELANQIAKSQIAGLPTIPDTITKIQEEVNKVRQEITDTKKLFEITLEVAKDNMKSQMIIEYDKNKKKHELKQQHINNQQNTEITELQPKETQYL